MPAQFSRLRPPLRLRVQVDAWVVHEQKTDLIGSRWEEIEERLVSLMESDKLAIVPFLRREIPKLWSYPFESTHLAYGR